MNVARARTRTAITSLKGTQYGILCLLVIPLIMGGCRTAMEDRTAVADDRPDDTTTRLAPGEQAPINPQTIAETRVTARPVEGEASSLPPQRTISATIEEMGPFAAGDADDGQWLRVKSMSGIPFVLIPGTLWAKSQDLHINTGVNITVEGYVNQARGRTYLHATAIGLPE